MIYIYCQNQQMNLGHNTALSYVLCRATTDTECNPYKQGVNECVLVLAHNPGRTRQKQLLNGLIL